MSMDYEYKPAPVKKGRSYVVTLLLSFLGCFGVHRFYTGYIGIGVAQLVMSITGIGGLVSSLWAFIDMVSIALNTYRDSDGDELDNYNPGCGMIVLILVGVSVLLMILAVIFGVMGALG